KGLKEGLKKGIEEGMEKGLEQGMEKGLEKGIEEGMEKGLEKGMEKGKADLLWKQILARFPKVPEQVRPKIQALSAERLDVLGTELWNMQEWQELERFF
ncbi:MAG TPA: DUF4351 domain-containing protein, partial [Thermotogota bacterium]|nr:DUF4351 domain-containing protein [Thermotogota bacterium]